MSNPFKYFRDKKELWADMERPYLDNYAMVDDYDGSSMYAGALYSKDLQEWNSRPHFPVSPELDALLAHEQIIDRKDFELKYYCDNGNTDCVCVLNCEGKEIAIPLPKEPECPVCNDTKFVPSKQYQDSDESCPWCVGNTYKAKSEQQDIPMENPINNLNNTVMQWIEKYLIEDYGRSRWNKMTREEQAFILNNFLNDLVKAIEKIRKIKLKL